MQNLIINADDFGMSFEVNEGVKKAIDSGIVNNVSLMVNLPYFEDAVNFLRAHPEVSVGLHFNVTEGKPVLPPAEVGSLLNEDDSFHFWTSLVPRLVVKDAKIEEVKKEFLAQYQKLEDTGLPITHIDSHHHLHLLPSLFKFFSQFAGERGIMTLRSQHFGIWSLTAGIGKRPTLKQIIITFMFWFDSLFYNHHRPSSDLGAIYDINWENNLSGPELLRILDNLPEGKTELICHLGVLSSTGNRKFLEPRLRKLEMLTRPQVKERILSNGITLFRRNGQGFKPATSTVSPDRFQNLSSSRLEGKISSIQLSSSPEKGLRQE